MKKSSPPTSRRILLADEGEAGPQLDEKLLDMLQQPFLKGALLGVVGE